MRQATPSFRQGDLPVSPQRPGTRRPDDAQVPHLRCMIYFGGAAAAEPPLPHSNIGGSSTTLTCTA